MQNIVVRPSAYRRFGVGHRDFYLVVEESLGDVFSFDGTDSYTHRRIVRVSPDLGLAEVLGADVPHDADVLVVATHPRLAEAYPADVVGRTVVVLPAGRGAEELNDVRQLLDTLEHDDPAVRRDTADWLRRVIATGDGLRILDGLTSSTATLDGGSPVVVGDIDGSATSSLHVVPDTGVALLPASGAGNPLPLSGHVAVKGWPLVRARGSAFGGLYQRKLHEQLLEIVRYPVVMTIDQGVVGALKAVDNGSDHATEALRELFTDDIRYSEVSALRFGVGPESTKTAHLVFGDLGSTTLELILPIVTSRVEDSRGAALVQGMDKQFKEIDGAPRRRLNRISSASCGCH